jgi:hypothetical protein
LKAWRPTIPGGVVGLLEREEYHACVGPGLTSTASSLQTSRSRQSKSGIRLLFACFGEDHELVSAEKLNREIPIE